MMWAARHLRVSSLKISTLHYHLTAMLPEPPGRFTNSLNASVFSRHKRERKIFQDWKNVAGLPLGIEPGEEDHRDDRCKQYDRDDEARPGCKMVEMFRVRSCGHH